MILWSEDISSKEEYVLQFSKLYIDFLFMNI